MGTLFSRTKLPYFSYHIDGVLKCIKSGDLQKFRRYYTCNDVQEVFTSTFSSTTALHEAVLEKQTNIVTFLLDVGHNVNCADRSKETPLHLTRDPEMAMLLLTHYADINSRNIRQMTPLLKAVVNKNDLVAELLIREGADLNLPDEIGTMPIHVCASYGKRELLLRLLACGADIDSQDKYGRTALYFTILSHHNDLLNDLISFGCNLNLFNQAKWCSPLQIGVIKCNAIAVHALINAGVKVDNSDVNEAFNTLIRVELRENGTDKLQDSIMIMSMILSSYGCAVSEMVLKCLIDKAMASPSESSKYRPFKQLVKKVLIGGCSKSNWDYIQPKLNILFGYEADYIGSLQQLCQRNVRDLCMASGRNVVWACENLKDIPAVLKTMLTLGEIPKQFNPT